MVPGLNIEQRKQEGTQEIQKFAIDDIFSFSFDLFIYTQKK